MAEVSSEGLKSDEVERFDDFGDLGVAGLRLLRLRRLVRAVGNPDMKKHRFT